MPFGLTNAPATFETTMQKILRPCRHFTTRLLDDILIFSMTHEQHTRDVMTVLRLLYRYNLQLQTRKCEWYASQVVFLGFLLDTTGIKPDPKKIAAVTARSYPTNVTDVRSFLNAAGYMRHFIPHFAKIASPLYDLTQGSPKPGTVIKFTEQHCDSFEKIKTALTSAPVLRPIQFGKAAIIDTDASSNCVGAVLFQAFPNPSSHRSELHPIAFESHKLTPNSATLFRSET